MAKKKRSKGLKDGDGGETPKQIGAEIRADLEEGKDRFYRVAARYIDVRDHKKYLPDYKTARAFALGEIPLELDELKMWMAIASHFSEQTADAYDPANLGLVIRFANAAHLTLPPDPGPLPIKFSSDASGTKPFSKCSAGDLRAAIKLAKGGAVPGGKIPAKDLKILNEAQGTFESSEGGEPPASMRWRMLNGRTKVTFADVDLYEAKAMMQIMASSFPDDNDVPAGGKPGKPGKRRPRRR